jgi:Penicillin amidase
VPAHRVAADRGSKGPRRVRSALNAIAALIATAAVLYAAFFGAGPLPALGPAFNPVTGAWTMAADASISSETLHLAGLDQPARVTFESDGTAHIVAQTDHDLFLATGYVHARFRLFQMDVLRRQGDRFAIPAGAVIGLLGWALQLAAIQVQYGAGSAAESLAAIMGFGHQAAIPVVLTCAVGLLLGLTGAWLGSAARTILSPLPPFRGEG